MLFIDDEKFTLGQDELNQLKAVFPEFMMKNKPQRIAYTESASTRVQTNNPHVPWVHSKPLKGILLFHTWADPETGEEREVRYTDSAPKFGNDGRRQYGSKSLMIDSGFMFNPERHKELLWFCYNFCQAFENGKKGNQGSSFKFLMPEKDAKTKAISMFAEAKAKAAIGNLTKEKMVELCQSLGIALNYDDTNKELILSRLYTEMDNNADKKAKLIETFSPEHDDEIRSMIEEAWNIDAIMPSLDGEKTVVMVGDKEVVLAEIPVDNREALAEYLAKDKKALALLKKVLA